MLIYEKIKKKITIEYNWKKEIKWVTEKKIKGVMCDFCKKKFFIKNKSNEIVGLPITNINLSRWYGSKYDTCDFYWHICESCFEKKFKKYLKQKCQE